MKAASGVMTIVISPIGVFMTRRVESGYFTMLSTSMSIGPCGVWACIEPTVCVAWTASIFALPPTKSWIFLTNARPSGLLDAGFGAAAAAPAAAGFAPGSGIVMSIGVTVPRVESGLSKSFSLPTTSTDT